MAKANPASYIQYSVKHKFTKKPKTESEICKDISQVSEWLKNNQPKKLPAAWAVGGGLNNHKWR